MSADVPSRSAPAPEGPRDTPHDTPRGTPRDTSGVTLQRRVGRATLGFLALILVLVVVVLFSLLDAKDKGDEVVNRWDPALSASERALTALVNQETGIRGYALSRRTTFLQPYLAYRAPEREAEQQLSHLVNGVPGLQRSLANFVARADEWHTGTAVPFIARVRSGDTSVGTAVLSETAKVSFDRIRAAAASLGAQITRQRQTAIAARTRSFTLVWIAIGVGVVVLLGVGLVLRRGLQRGVLQPIAALAEQTRLVATGELDRTIERSGPPELLALGDDVDSMRAALASQLARVEDARAELAERGAELARSNSDLEQFAYVASHDLSEPLRKVTNFCQLLERQYGKDLDDKAKQYIAFVVDGAKRMQILINDLLAFSRVGRTTDSFVPVDLEKVLTRVQSILEEPIRSANATVVSDPMPTVDGDATLLTALIQNLVGNAVKYRSPDRDPVVEVTARREGDDWLISVSDNGIGIDPRYADRIFVIFQRLHLRDQYSGTGIGLALCRKIVEYHKGELWLGEKAGPGATFQLRIPEHHTPRTAVAEDGRPTMSDSTMSTAP